MKFEFSKVINLLLVVLYFKCVSPTYNFYNLFPPFPRDNKVFVAMSFDKKFEYRWENVIKPAVEIVPASSSSSDVMLEPYRVDMRMISDSIITDIVGGIGNCRLIFADITGMDCFDTQKNKINRVNQNVAYEVGIAHAVRLPEEVILFKSDDEDIMFDLANVRVNKYKPDNDPEESKLLVKEALMSAIKEIDLRKHLSVKYAVDSLDIESIQYLLDIKFKGSVVLTKKSYELFNSKPEAFGTFILTMRANTIRLLLDLGIIRTSYPEFNSNLLNVNEKGRNEKSKKYYLITSFGEAVIEEMVARLGLTDKF